MGRLFGELGLVSVVAFLVTFAIINVADGYYKAKFDKEPRWGIPPNVTVEYDNLTCYQWNIPTVKNPKEKYVYCEPKEITK